MENLSLIDVNKPEKVKQALNELLAYKNQAMELPNITAETLGLGNVDNTSDEDKPVSIAQKNYIDNENAKDVKLASDDAQKINSDIVFADKKKLLLERADKTIQEGLSIENEDGYENVNVGSDSIPLKLHHATQDINGTKVARNPKISIKDGDNITEETLAFSSEVQALEKGKVNNNVFENAEFQDGAVTKVEGVDFTNNAVDNMSLEIVVRSIKSGNVVNSSILPLKLANSSSRGLMSKEAVIKLEELLKRVSAIEGKTSRYFYTKSTSPTAEEINTFVENLGHSAPFDGVAVVVDGTYHIWHYYENDIGWRDDGSDTVNQATNTTLGIIKGSEEVGKGFIESDGTISVTGFDNVKEKADYASEHIDNKTIRYIGKCLIENCGDEI